MSCTTSIFVIITIHVTCWIVRITTSGAFHKGYNAGWPYNNFNPKWHPRYGPKYTAILVKPIQDSYSSSLGSSSAEDSSNSESISNPSHIKYRNTNKKHRKTIKHRKRKKNNCKCSCKNCDRQKECCKDKCKRCRISSILTKPIPTWPPYYTQPTYIIMPYMLPIMYRPSCATTTSSPSTTSQTTSTTTPTTTTTTTSTTTTTPKTTTTTTPKTTTTTTTKTTTTTTTPETTTTTTTTSTTSTTTTTTSTTTTTTTTTTSPHTRSTHFVQDEISESSTSSYRILHATSDTSSQTFKEDTAPFSEKNDNSEEDDAEKNDGEEDDGTTVSPHELPTHKIITSHTDYVYYDDTLTITAKSSSQDHVYHYYEDSVTTDRPNRRCETPKCLRKKKKTYYYLMKPVATTKLPFLMSTKAVIPRKSFSVVDNAMYNDGPVKGYYNMVDDENMNYDKQYYYDDYYYYADKVYYNEMPVETVDL